MGGQQGVEVVVQGNVGIAHDHVLFLLVLQEVHDGAQSFHTAGIDAHATSTPIGDLNEAKAIAEVFEGHRPYVTSTKSMTGHEMWMAGASEVIYSTLMMQNNFIAPNLNFEEPDEASAQLNIPAQRVNMEFDTFLSNSFGFGGTNSTLIIKKVK